MRTTAPRAARDAAAVPIAPRTVITLAAASLVGLLAFTWPLIIDPGGGTEHATDAPLVLAGLLLMVVAVVLVSLSDGGIDVKAVAVLGLLTALGSVLRPLSAGTAGVELVFLTIVLGGRVFGAGFGFVLGSTTLFASALLTGGAGPWLPFQMLGASWVGLGAGLLPRRVRGRAEIAVLCGYGVLASFCFGVLMNLSFWPFLLGAGTDLSFVAGGSVGTNLHRFWLYTLATSLGWDVGRAATTAVGLAVLGPAVLAALRRTSSRAVFGPPVTDGPRNAAGVAPVDGTIHRNLPDPRHRGVPEPGGGAAVVGVPDEALERPPEARHAGPTD